MCWSEPVVFDGRTTGRLGGSAARRAAEHPRALRRDEMLVHL